MYAESPGPGCTSYVLRSSGALSSNCQLQPASLERWMDFWPMVISVFGSSRAATFAYVTARSLPAVGARVSPSDWVIVTEPSPYTVSQCGAFQNQPGSAWDGTSASRTVRALPRAFMP